MGAKQSQDSTTTTTGYSGDSTLLEPASLSTHHHHHHHHGQEDPSNQSPPTLPSFFSLLSGSLSNASEEPRFHDVATSGGGGGGDRRENSSGSYFDRDVREDTREEDGASVQVNHHLDSTSQRRPHQEVGSSSHHQPHHHHHRRRHHHHHHHHEERRRGHHDQQEGGTGEHAIRNGRSQRYLYHGEHDRSNIDMELDFSFAALSERLRALQLSEESGGSTRRHGRSHGHSRHRHNNSSLMSGGALVFMTERPEIKTACPICKKEYSYSSMESHMVQCRAKPRVKYNEDSLLQDAGECSICLEDMNKGDSIARLPCLCIYHITCLKQWYEKNQTCPEHPEISSA